MSRLTRELGRVAVIAAGLFSAAFGLKGFLLPNHLIDGGVTGVSMLLATAAPLPLAVWLPLVNLPFVAIGYHQIGRRFAIRSALAIAGLALVLALVHFPTITADGLLTAVFGGFFLGGGIGLAVRAGAVLDGTEIAALLISRRSQMLSVGDVILGFNVVLFLVAMSVLGVDNALYSILTYLAAARTVDFVLHGIDEYTGVTIVSQEHAAIRRRITDELGRGVTVYKGYGGMSGAELDILYCVVTRLELGRVKGIAGEVDGTAFIVYQPLTGAEGGVLKRMAHSTGR